MGQPLLRFGADLPNLTELLYTRWCGIGRGGKDGQSITFFTGSNHERSLAGELARVLRESGVDVTALSSKFPMSIKKKTHGVYGAFYREDVDMSAVPKRKVFED